MAMSCLFAERFDLALSWAEQSFRQLPSFVFVVLDQGEREASRMGRVIETFG
jgi:hypothetical protein